MDWFLKNRKLHECTGVPLVVHVEMLEFRIGERVEFEPAGHPLQMGVVTRHNQKTVTVITDSGQRWTVSPQLLRHASEPKQEATSNPNVIRLPKRKL